MVNQLMVATVKRSNYLKLGTMNLCIVASMLVTNLYQENHGSDVKLLY